MQISLRALAVASAVTADLFVLRVERGNVGATLAGLRAPRSWAASAGTDAAAAQLTGAAIWCVAAWAAVGVSIGLCAALPGSAGRAGRAISRMLVPAALRRTVAALVGVSVLASPALAVAQSDGRSGPPVTTQAAHSGEVGVLPAPVLPVGLPTVPTVPIVPSPYPPSRPVVVRPGDTLWDLAQLRLGEKATDAATAASWPRWYEANRARIGSDPNLIRPGQALRPPPTEKSS